MNYKYGLKIYTDDINVETIEIVKKVLKEENTIEFAMYRDSYIEDKDIELMELMNFNRNNILYHADFKKFDIYEYIKSKENINNFINEIKNAERLNASKIIFHLEHVIIIKKYRYEYMIDKSIEMFNELYKRYPKSKDVVILIENIFSEIDFYKVLVTRLKEEGFNIGFTLDIGHLKVSSEYSLRAGINITKELNKIMPIHYHIHANEGISDTHTPLHKGIKKENFNTSKDDTYYSGNLIEEIKEIHKIAKEKENVTITLETNIKDSVKDYELLTGERIEK